MENLFGKEIEFPCTDCGGDASFAYYAQGKNDWHGKIKEGERICIDCAEKRGLKFFDNDK